MQSLTSFSNSIHHLLTYDNAMTCLFKCRQRGLYVQGGEDRLREKKKYQIIWKLPQILKRILLRFMGPYRILKNSENHPQSPPITQSADHHSDVVEKTTTHRSQATCPCHHIFTLNVQTHPASHILLLRPLLSCFGLQNANSNLSIFNK